jgi:very-short-patch-repair endonuclease
MDRATSVARGRQAISGMEAELAQLLAALQLDAQRISELPIPKTSNLRIPNNSPHLLRQLGERIVCWLQLLLCRRRHEPIWERFGCPAPTMSSLEAYGHWVTDLSRSKYLITKIRILATDLPTEKEQLQDGERLDLLNTQIRRDMSRLLPSLVKSFDLIDDSDRQRLMEIRGNTERSRISGADVATILKHYPVWALSNLTVARFAPPEPLFDYVVIDEASQCDIASALPLLARARRAVIVGDPAQLGVVSTLSPDWEAEILDSFGLSSAPGIGRFRQSSNSLFDLASTASGASRHLLSDHFRCHKDIAAYVEGFYGSQLSVMTQERELNPPPGQRPGLFWENVNGPVEEATRGCHSPSEANAIVDALHHLIIDQKYDGTVGVCTPFREQANRITDRIASSFSPELVTQRRLIAQTANGFQGDARDVIFVSLCIGPDMPVGSLAFVREGGNLFNVAISRAKAVCRIFGNAQFARRCDVPHIVRLVGTCDRQSRRSEERPSFDSPWEEKLFNALASVGIKCVPQFQIAGRRLDLAWFDSTGKKIDIEVDGDRYHRDPSGLRKVDDIWRDHQLRGLGWEVLRFWVYELRESMDGCVERVRHAVTSR